MARLLVLSLLCLLAWYHLPEPRMILEGASASLMDPVTRWDAHEEMERIGRNVVAHERLTGDIPTEATWHAWLEARYEGDGAERDGWGSTYELRVWSDSVGVVSLGPDRLPDTDDDLQVVTPRS